ncbi:hypothetical protein RB614_24110 [Phytohabitans sp. ZYX-F-186]|uniref:EfeO-type cupredoxin-like domain-containing protein n=1 Tax=Phytohabitans maris TaxID=3071409 RepID=A0ABU0ZMW5_9ACTN|nr:hypothetical protein [Phytohabitans sp. ZYX-F-186]MDQ7907610.1 hypothetical protein [Phytohabitans sp. ZYX-F-186]
MSPLLRKSCRPLLAVAVATMLLTATGCERGRDVSQPRSTRSGAGSPSAGASSVEGASAGPSLSGSSPATDARLVEVTVRGGEVDPAPGRVTVRKGERVRLVVHSDVADEVHVHGYDREAAVGPGHDATIEFVADQTGLFEVETHETGMLLTQLLVR